MRPFYTRHQVPREARPDAAWANQFYLIKNVSELHATYQIQKLTGESERTGQKLVIRVPLKFRAHDCLRRWISDHRKIVSIEKRP